ncbi:MAG: S1/P1 nuclease [Robiginitomaculum sp.]|nr:S1/P1 nuclease [Robiginitomaculum sp.]
MFRFLIIVLSVAAFASQVMAWGSTGHRVTGAIAEPMLSEDARSQVREILGTEGLAEASTWPDFMRASPDKFWQREARSYHYVTVPKDKTYQQVGAPDRGDAVTALKKFAAVLQDPDASRDEKALALRFTIHLVGDLHQPLHAGNGKDRGGNSFSVVYFDNPTNLHSVWDSAMVDREKLSYSEKSKWLQSKITEDQISDWSNADPLVWIAESTKLRDTIYPKQQIISWEYTFNNIGIVDQRLSQAGVRLAIYLNELFALEE